MRSCYTRVPIRGWNRFGSIGYVLTYKALSSKIIKRDRAQLYQEPAVQLLLATVLDDDMGEITPVLDSGKDVRYPAVENILGWPSSEVLELINKLVHIGIFRRRFYQKLISCPKCGLSSKVFLKYSCPHCNSSNLTVRKDIQHPTCGRRQTVSASTSELICSGC